MSISFLKNKSTGLSIKSKLLLFTLSSSLIPITIFTTVYYFNTRSTLKKYQLQEMTAIARSRVLHVQTILNAKKAWTLDFSTDGFIRDSLDKVDKDCVTVLKQRLGKNENLPDPDIDAFTLCRCKITTLLNLASVNHMES